jgi:hypothetical protein
MRTKAEILERKKYLEKCIVDAEQNDEIGWFATEQIRNDCTSRMDELDWILGQV